VEKARFGGERVLTASFHPQIWDTITAVPEDPYKPSEGLDMSTSSAEPHIAAVILAAGQSRRMGQPKMILPWGTHTVIAQVVSVLAGAGVVEIVAVVGGARRQVEAALAELPVRTVFNPRFEEYEMTASLQTGLGVLSPNIQACLVVLGDQPQIESEVVNAVIAAYQTSGADLVIPSYQMRRGHPWLVSKPLWKDIQALQPPATMRDFINRHVDRIHYLEVASASVLKDLDTPGDYYRERPGSGNPDRTP
jgi:molybdenum cofactor cytidylyltransferase